MELHTKIYFDYFGYDVNSFIPCELCGAKSVDISHIKPRGLGGSKQMDIIENLQASCRQCHIDYGDKSDHFEFLVLKHAATLQMDFETVKQRILTAKYQINSN